VGIRAANNIFAKNLSCLKGKTVRQSTSHVDAILAEVLLAGRDMIVAINIIFVNKHPFLSPFHTKSSLEPLREYQIKKSSGNDNLLMSGKGCQLVCRQGVDCELSIGRWGIQTTPTVVFNVEHVGC
jgi:hypothetical protein